MKDLKRLFGYLGPYRRDLWLGALLIVIETSFELIIPVLMSDIIDVGVASGDVGIILQKGVEMGICALLSLATGLLYARYAARASYGLGARIRDAEYAKVQQYAFGNLDHFETSSLVTRMTTDVTVLQNAINGGFRPMVRGPVMLIMGVGLSFWMNAKLAVVFLVCTPVLAVILACILRQYRPHVRSPASGDGPSEQCGAGMSHCHPRGQGVCPRRIRGRKIPGRQPGTDGRQPGYLPHGGAQPAGLPADHVCRRGA